MIARLSRGQSFNSLARYLTQDKREPGQPQPTTSARVGFTETLNFDGDAPQGNVVIAARIMAAVWKAREWIKRKVNIKPGGTKAKAPPVLHGSLSWPPGEQVTPQAMKDAVRDALAAIGLDLARGYQTVIIEHTDTKHRHVHFVVNLVHPATGRQANPFNDQPKIQAWARAYDRQRGTIVCPAREAKYAAIDEARAAARAQFNKTAGQGRKRQTRRGDPDHQAKADRYGRDRTKARQPRQPRQPKPAMRTQFRQASDDGTPHDPASIIEALTAQQSTFTRRDLARHIWTRCADGDEFRALMVKVEAAPELVRLGRDGKGFERFTARDLQAIERRMIEDAVALHGRTGHAVSNWKRLHALQALQQGSGITLTDEQKAAFQHITGQADIAAVIGFAGSGKSTMLEAARLAWEASGYRVRGAALSGIAADGLQAGAGIDSGTIHALLFALDKGRDCLAARDVLVIDEAGMIGSRLLARVLAHAANAGAKVVLVGDPEQLQAIDAGAAFRAIVDRIGAAKITAIRRQRETWQQQATRELATAKTEAALDRYAQAGMLHGHATASAAKAALIDRWNHARLANPNASQIILAYRRADVRDLNEQARALRQEAGELGPDHAIQTAQGTRQFATGDRLYFLKNDRKLGVKNGSLATVESIEGDRLTVRLDNGGRVSFSLAAYSQIDHGYAATVHKSQGVTVDRAHVLATRHMDRHAAYVAMTRHRDRLDVHWSCDDLADRASLSQTLGRDRAKDTTLDYDAIPPSRTYGKAASAAPSFQANY